MQYVFDWFWRTFHSSSFCLWCMAMHHRFYTWFNCSEVSLKLISSEDTLHTLISTGYKFRNHNENVLFLIFAQKKRDISPGPYCWSWVHLLRIMQRNTITISVYAHLEIILCISLFWYDRIIICDFYGVLAYIDLDNPLCSNVKIFISIHFHLPSLFLDVFTVQGHHVHILDCQFFISQGL